MSHIITPCLRGYSIWKVGRGDVWCQLFRPPRSDFSTIFWGAPQWLFSHQCNAKYSPSDHCAVISELFSDHHAAFLKMCIRHPPTNFSNGIALNCTLEFVFIFQLVETKYMDFILWVFFSFTFFSNSLLILSCFPSFKFQKKVRYFLSIYTVECIKDLDEIHWLK